VDAAVLVVTRRDPALLPLAMNAKYAAFVAPPFKTNADAKASALSYGSNCSGRSRAGASAKP
jgi:hypothetical protein